MEFGHFNCNFWLTHVGNWAFEVKRNGLSYRRKLITILSEMHCIINGHPPTHAKVVPLLDNWYFEGALFVSIPLLQCFLLKVFILFWSIHHSLVSSNGSSCCWSPWRWCDNRRTKRTTTLIELLQQIYLSQFHQHCIARSLFASSQSIIFIKATVRARFHCNCLCMCFATCKSIRLLWLKILFTWFNGTRRDDNKRDEEE